MSGRLSPQVIDVQRVTLTENLRAPSRARAWLTEQVSDLPEAVLDDALLVTSELVTNAIRYGQPDITLSVAQRGDNLRIEVADHGEALPLMTRQAPHRDAASGLTRPLLAPGCRPDTSSTAPTAPAVSHCRGMRAAAVHVVELTQALRAKTKSEASIVCS